MTPTPASFGQIDYDLPCFRCEYNLRDVAVAGACPRCGEPVSRSAHGFLAQVDERGRVKYDVYCSSCGHNVRSLDAKGICTECGTPVTHALRGSELRFADSRWVRGLSRGVLYMILSMGAGLALYAVFFIVVMRAAVLGQLGPGASPFGGPTTWVPMLFALMGVLGLNMAGLLAVSRKEPRQFDASERFTARRVVRLVMLMLPVAVIMSIVNAALQVSAPRGLKVAFGVLTLVTFIVSMAGWWILPLALVRLFAGLLKRVPSPGLVRFAKIEFWAMLISGAVFVVSYGLFIAVMIKQGPALQNWQTQMMAQAGGPRQFANSGGGPRTAKQRRRARDRDIQDVELLDFSKREGGDDESVAGPESLTTEETESDSEVSAAADDSSASATAASPASTPTATPPPFPPMMTSGPILALMAAYGLSGCVFSMASLAYVVLIILVWRAFAKAATETTAFAAAR